MYVGMSDESDMPTKRKSQGSKPKRPNATQAPTPTKHPQVVLLLHVQALRFQAGQGRAGQILPASTVPFKGRARPDGVGGWGVGFFRASCTVSL